LTTSTLSFLPCSQNCWSPSLTLRIESILETTSLIRSALRIRVVAAAVDVASAVVETRRRSGWDSWSWLLPPCSSVSEFLVFCFEVLSPGLASHPCLMLPSYRRVRWEAAFLESGMVGFARGRSARDELGFSNANLEKQQLD
jgi:hypothetical protein